MRRAFLVGLVGTFLVLTFTVRPTRTAAKIDPPSGANNVAAEVAKIKAYHDQIDAWAKAHPTAVHYFSTKVQDDNSSPWGAYKTKGELPPLETHASVWIKDGLVVATIISFKSDHTNSTDGSYFRADGTLAYRETHNYSIGIDPPFWDSIAYYGSDGKPLRSTNTCSIDGTKKIPCKAEGSTDSGSDDDRLYLKNTSLPFWNLIGK